MKIRFSIIANGMIWSTLPMMSGLYYWEHALRMTASSHKLIQIMLLLIVFGWVYFWNLQLEQYHLRLYLDNKTAQTQLRCRMTTVSLHEAESLCSDPDVSPSKESLSKDGKSFNTFIHEMLNLFKVKSHVSNH